MSLAGGLYIYIARLIHYRSQARSRWRLDPCTYTHNMAEYHGESWVWFLQGAFSRRHWIRKYQKGGKSSFSTSLHITPCKGGLKSMALGIPPHVAILGYPKLYTFGSCAAREFFHAVSPTLNAYSPRPRPATVHNISISSLHKDYR